MFRKKKRNKAKRRHGIIVDNTNYTQSDSTKIKIKKKFGITTAEFKMLCDSIDITNNVHIMRLKKS